MKKLNKVLALVLALTMAFAMFAFVACEPAEEEPNEDEKTTIKDVTIWVSESAGVTDLTLEQVKAYNEREDGKYIIDVASLKIEGVSESESATQMITDVESGADIFCFAQDQTARLVQAGALAQPGVQATATITANNDAGAVAAATIGSTVYAYPMTSDNGYFLIYDKRVITDESHLDDLAALVADCEAANRNFAMETETSAWYLASFFFATGCHSNWNIDDNGTAISIDDTFNSAEGIVALKGMQQLVKSPNYISSSNASEFSAAIPAAVLVSGTWAITEVANIIGEENVGCADLPSFTVDGKSYHMGSYSGNKLMGVKPSKDTTRAAALQDLALYLTNEECQLARFSRFGWGPSNKAAQEDEAVQSNVALSALAQQNNYATPQGQIDGSWWDIAKVIGTAAKEADLNDETALQAALDAYDVAISGVINKDEADANRWTVIGALYGSNWTVDYTMKEQPAGTWTSIPLYLEEGTEFKVRKGQSWNEDSGSVAADCEYAETAEGGNAKATTAGLYFVKFNSTTKEITLVPITLGVIGSFNDWNGDVAMTQVEAEEEGVVVAYISEAITLEESAELKVRPNSTWDFGDFGADDDGSNLKVESAGNYQVKLTLTDAYEWVLSVVSVAE